MHPLRLSILALALVLFVPAAASASGCGGCGAKRYWRDAAANWGTKNCNGRDQSGCVLKGSAQPQSGGAPR
jgi:hypothetical protein